MQISVSLVGAKEFKLSMATENPLIPENAGSAPAESSTSTDDSSQAASPVGVSSGRKQGRGGMVFDTTPASVADAAAASPSPPDLKPLSTSIEPSNPVEAFIGEMALAIQQGPFHRFFQQIGKSSNDETKTEPSSQRAITDPPQAYIFSAGETLPLGVRASARMDARKTKRHIKPGEQILVTRVFSAKGVPFAELAEGGFVPMVHPRSGKPIVTKAVQDDSGGGGSSGTTALAAAVGAAPGQGSQLLALADADDAAATQHAHQLVDLAATAAAAAASSSSSSQPAQRSTLPLESVKTITRGCLALNGECTSSKRSRARAADQLGFMVKESELRVKELDALFKTQRATWAELGQSLGVPLVNNTSGGGGGGSGDPSTSSSSSSNSGVLGGNSSALTLPSSSSTSSASHTAASVVNRVPEQLLAHVGACGESAAGELRQSRAFTSALKLAHARAEGADAAAATAASAASAAADDDDTLVMAALGGRKHDQKNSRSNQSRSESVRAAAAATAAASSAERVAQELGEARETVEGLLKDPATKLPPGVKYALLGLNASLQELTQLAQPLPGALNDAAAAVSASSTSGVGRGGGGVAAAAVGTTTSDTAVPTAPLTTPSAAAPAAAAPAAAEESFNSTKKTSDATSPRSLSTGAATVKATAADVSVAATAGGAVPVDAVQNDEVGASASSELIIESSALVEGGGTAGEVESISSSKGSSDAGAQKKKKKSKKQSKKSANVEDSAHEASVAAVAAVASVTKVQYNSDSDAEGGFEDF